jgi:hypothetical protein
MPESQPTSHPLRRTWCDHRFDVVCVEGQFILTLWECRYCGQRIRRKKLADVRRPADHDSVVVEQAIQNANYPV